jgi:tmRNA-binding protein
MYGERKGIFKVLVGISEGKKTLERRRRMILRRIIRKWDGGHGLN